MNWLPFRRNTPADAGPLAPDSDAHPAGTHPRQPVQDDPEAGRRLRRRRRAVVIVVLMFCVLAAIGALVGEGGALDARGLRSKVLNLRSAVARQEAEVAGLEQEVLSLARDPFARERIAREQLGLVREGEIDFLLPRPQLLAPPGAPDGAAGR